MTKFFKKCQKHYGPFCAHFNPKNCRQILSLPVFFFILTCIIFGKSLQYLKKEMRDEVDFLYRETSKFPASLYCYI